MLLLDTNVVSELRKPKPHGGLMAWYNSHPLQTMSISSVVLYELQAGAERTRQQDIAKAEELDEWIKGLANRLAVLPFGSEEARVTARLLRKKSLDLLPDAMIAATASVYGLTVVTRNIHDFQQFPVRLHNPFISL